MLIRKHLQSAAEKTMKEALDEGIRSTQIFKGIPTIHWKDILYKLELTLGYDIGWTKRSSGNRYDSLSGHVFLVGCHSKKNLGGQVTSKEVFYLFLCRGKG